MRKNLTKRAAAVMSAVMLAALTACGSSKSAEEILNEASAKSSAMTEMDMTMDMDFTMAQGDQSMEMILTMDMKGSSLDTEAMIYSADSNVNVTVGEVNQTIDSSTYFKDGYIYTDTLGQKIKYPMDLAAMMETVKGANLASGIQADDMLELSAKKDGDNQIITFVADPVKLSNTMQEAMGLMQGQLGPAGDMEIDLTKTEGTFVVNKDGDFTNMDMIMEYEITLMGTSISLEGDLALVINNPGQPVEVIIPDTEGFQEVAAPLR